MQPIMSPKPAWLLAAGLALVGCEQAAVPLPQGDTIRAGAVLSLTGSLAPDGQRIREGYGFCQDWINTRGGISFNGTRHPFQIRIEDDGSRASASSDLAQRLIAEDGIKLLLGPSSFVTAAKVASIAEEHHVPVVLASQVSDAVFSERRYVFGVLTPASRQLAGVFDLAVTLQPPLRTVAILHSNDSFSTEVAAAGRDYAAQKGLEVVSVQRYPSGTNDLRRQLAAASAATPDLLVESGHADEGVLTLRQAQQLQVQAQAFAFSDGPTSVIVSELQQAAAYTFGATQWSPQARVRTNDFLSSAAYAGQYEARFGHQPDARGAAATAACLALQAAIQNAGSVEPKAVRDKLAALDLQTFFGPIRFDEHGRNAGKPITVEQVQDGKVVVVWPRETATAPAKYPMPAWERRQPASSPAS